MRARSLAPARGTVLFFVLFDAISQPPSTEERSIATSDQGTRTFETLDLAPAPLVSAPEIRFPHRLLPWAQRCNALNANRDSLEEWKAAHPTVSSGWVIFQHGRFLVHAATRQLAYDAALRNSNFDSSEDRYCVALSQQRSYSMCPTGRIYVKEVNAKPAANRAPHHVVYKHSPLTWAEVRVEDAPTKVVEVQMKIDTGAEVCGCSRQLLDHLNPPMESIMQVETLNLRDGGEPQVIDRAVYVVSIKVLGDPKDDNAIQVMHNVEMIEFGMNLLGCNILQYYNLHITDQAFVHLQARPGAFQAPSGPPSPFPHIPSPLEHETELRAVSASADMEVQGILKVHIVLASDWVDHDQLQGSDNSHSEGPKESVSPFAEVETRLSATLSGTQALHDLVATVRYYCACCELIDCRLTPMPRLRTS